MYDDKLIVEVRSRSFLWDKTDNNHFNRNMISIAWESIAKEMGEVTGAQCKNRWTSIKDYFHRKHKQMKTTKSGQSASTTKKWHLYDFLMFLAPTTSSGATMSGNLPNLDEDSGPSIVDQCQPQTNVPAIPQSVISEETAGPLPRKRRAAKNTEMTAVDREVLKALPLKEPETTNMAENEHFFKSLLPSLKKLDELETMQFRIEVQQLVLSYMQRTRARKQNNPASPRDIVSIPFSTTSQAVSTPSVPCSTRERPDLKTTSYQQRYYTDVYYNNSSGQRY